jgi:hypothetical protein
MGWLVSCFLTVRPAAAIYLDDGHTLFFTGLFYNQLRLRTEDPRGFNTKVGDWTMLQHRYFVDPQLRADVFPWIRNVGGEDFLEAVTLEEARFFFNPRFEYDGVYDYGPQAFRDDLPPRLQKGNRFRIFEMYGDLRLLRLLNIRVGRQNLSWGETDGFRLLDRINPLDNGFGGFLVPLDERRVPLTMLRATVGLPDLPEWEVFNSALEGFIAPDKSLPKGAPGPTPWGVQGGPLSPVVAPTLFANIAQFGPPQGNQLQRPNVNLRDSRWGVRLLGSWQDISFTLAHISTYPDGPTPSLQRNSSGAPVIKLRFPTMQVTGFTASGPVSSFQVPVLRDLTYTIFRTEVAGFFGEPFFIEKINFDMGRSLPKRNVIRGVLGLDHNQWIRSLNSQQTFFISGQFFYTNIQGSMAGIKVPLVASAHNRRTLNRFIDVDRENFLNTLIINTLYPGVNLYFLTPQLQPQLTFNYEWEGAWLIQPQLTFIRDPWRFRVEYNWLDGRFIGLGFLQDKDNLAFRIDYLL